MAKSRRRYVEVFDVMRPVPLDHDCELAVPRHPSGRRDELTDDYVLLQTGQVVHLALDGGVGKDTGGLLERGRREEAVGGERGLGYAHEHRMELGRPAALTL